MEEVKLTKELINSLDLYNADPALREELAHLCMFTNGGEDQALFTAYTCFEYAMGIKLTDVIKFFANRLQTNIDNLKDNYISIVDRDKHLYDKSMNGLQVGIGKDGKLFICYYDHNKEKFYDSLSSKKKRVFPVAIFRYINKNPLINLVNKNFN